MADAPGIPGSGGGGRFSALLLQGLDHYRHGRMLEAVRAWEEAYLLEPTNLRAREFLRSALERIHAHMGGPAGAKPSDAAAKMAPAGTAGSAHPWLPTHPTGETQIREARSITAEMAAL